MKIIVTGGAGFIGSHVAQRLLYHGHSVAIVDDLNDFYPPEMKRANLSIVLAQKPAEEPASEGHPHKWQVIEKSLYEVLQDGFDVAAVVYDTAGIGQSQTPDVHYFLQKGADLVRCDFRKREATSYYWCYALTKPNAP